ncbi:hypothetical protein EYF80_020549 [Liparis tanakae]|uniref:Uncharacterized protein n=1 Tax=Liparis tanakae TaxID=230148 RepID=A0A4Z2HWG8_9TELE|nr:hypothetical protein EYF80_020549 [Liparis tanakae]
MYQQLEGYTAVTAQVLYSHQQCQIPERRSERKQRNGKVKTHLKSATACHDNGTAHEKDT